MTPRWNLIQDKPCLLPGVPNLYVSDDNLCFFAIEFIPIWQHNSLDLASSAFLAHG